MTLIIGSSLLKNNKGTDTPMRSWLIAWLKVSVTPVGLALRLYGHWLLALLIKDEI
jgi:hypothetical protein